MGPVLKGTITQYMNINKDTVLYSHQCYNEFVKLLESGEDITDFVENLTMDIMIGRLPWQEYYCYTRFMYPPAFLDLCVNEIQYRGWKEESLTLLDPYNSRQLIIFITSDFEVMAWPLDNLISAGSHLARSLACDLRPATHKMLRVRGTVVFPPGITLDQIEEALSLNLICLTYHNREYWYEIGFVLQIDDLVHKYVSHRCR